MNKRLGIIILSMMLITLFCNIGIQAATSSLDEKLLTAVWEEDLQKIDELLASGASLETHDEEGYTPLTIAASNNSLELVEFLLNKGADPNASDNWERSLLDIIILERVDFEIVETLIARGADVHLSDEDGNIIIRTAICFSSDSRIIELLVDSGIDPNSTVYGDTSLIDYAYDKALYFEAVYALQVAIAKSQPALETDVVVFLNDMGRVLGGSRIDQWIDITELEEHLAPGQIFRYYADNEYVGEAAVIDIYPESYIFGGKSYAVWAEPYQFSDFAFNGSWDPLPRLPVVQENCDLTPELSLFLQEVGVQDLEGANVRILSVDLNDDGFEEMLIEVTNITLDVLDKFFEREELDLSKFYSFVVLKQQNQSGDEFYTVVRGDSEALVKNTVEFVADLNGDNSLEFGLRTVFYEHLWVEGWATNLDSVYKLEYGEVKLITACHFNPQ